MKLSIFTTLAAASSALAAPTWPAINPASLSSGGLEHISEYFNLLADKISKGPGRGGPNGPLVQTCDLSKATLPQAPVPLEPPSAGLVLKHVAVGRGTQNYTCDTANPSAAPVANGAMATLFNASCVAASYPDIASKLSALALQFDLSAFPTSGDESVRMGPSNLLVSGNHFFLDGKTPYFSLDTKNFGKLGHATFAKKSGTDAPADAPKGLKGEKAVAWLKLVAGGSEAVRIQATGGLEEVYRVETAGGSPPATCQGMPATFEVQYATQYWFYAK
ncbi:malate dehydrogenase [Microdochium bolleyi]|uniref:Malate dehydrogenase n=1 Tax=Microdochium bolleyi TaxID=196109 RepID=A0A136J6M5_9PEZI|nr:malate dehydrogenase [Microdochium bolleyi]